MDRKKIIVTLGPSSLTKEVVKKMEIMGVDIFRINLSHIQINEFDKIIKMVRGWTDRPVCPDSEGAQLRTGKIKNNSMFLKIGSMFIIGVTGLSADGLMLPLIMTTLLTLALIYTTLGGMFSVIITDYIQFVILSFVLLFTTYFGIRSDFV